MIKKNYYFAILKTLEPVKSLFTINMEKASTIICKLVYSGLKNQDKFL